MKTNPIVLEMLMQRFRSVAEEMGYSVQRTGYTAFVNETADLGVALVTPAGEIFGYPKGIGITMFINLDMADAFRSFDSYDEGDIVITNDPYTSGALSSHLPDVNLFRPVFHQGKLVCFTFAYVHSTDVGGNVAGSLTPSNYEVFQEGIRIPPIKLYRKDVPNDDVLKLIMNNVRVPADNWGDLRAMITALRVGERRVHELIERYGLADFQSAMDDCLAYSETRARAVIRRIPEGTYRFHDYLDDDVASEVPVRLAVAITVKGDAMHFDFTGTDPQLKSAFNLYSAGKPHPWLIYKLISVFMTMEPDMPFNAGMMRPVSVTAPEGSVVNCVFPAAIGLRTTMGVRLQDAVMGALAQALPEYIPAAGSGTIVPIVFAEPSASGRGVEVNVLEPLSGGTGGCVMADGLHARDVVDIANLRNNPLEAVESKSSTRVLQYALRADSAGAGEFRGGCGIVFEFEVLAPDCVIIARGMERLRFQPWGLLGGGCGANGLIEVKRAGAERFEVIAKADALRATIGDTVRLSTAGGGGYGDPLGRDAHRVLDDVLNGFVSIAGAERDYGVVVRNGTLDAPATAKLRGSRPRAASPALHTLGEARDRYEQLWNAPVSAAFSALLFSLPQPLRYEARGRLWRAMEKRRTEGKTTDAAALAGLWAELKKHLEKSSLRLGSALSKAA
ncbi:MAG: hydantoinase B/oxoprolinase family protein [Betaproteobacteria bacterium]|nr:hydantoinase B/oxoprolinase family protein [Betaproteobacteria bacterium]